MKLNITTVDTILDIYNYNATSDKKLDAFLDFPEYKHLTFEYINTQKLKEKTSIKQDSFTSNYYSDDSSNNLKFILNFSNFYTFRQDDIINYSLSANPILIKNFDKEHFNNYLNNSIKILSVSKSDLDCNLKSIFIFVVEMEKIAPEKESLLTFLNSMNLHKIKNNFMAEYINSYDQKISEFQNKQECAINLTQLYLQLVEKEILKSNTNINYCSIVENLNKTKFLNNFDIKIDEMVIKLYKTSVLIKNNDLSQTIINNFYKLLYKNIDNYTYVFEDDKIYTYILPINSKNLLINLNNNNLSNLFNISNNSVNVNNNLQLPPHLHFFNYLKLDTNYQYEVFMKDNIHYFTAISKSPIDTKNVDDICISAFYYMIKTTINYTNIHEKDFFEFHLNRIAPHNHIKNKIRKF